jgi:pSer/pThr/pTyr-binding forkhead associated (FHA) protein
MAQPQDDAAPSPPSVTSRLSATEESAATAVVRGNTPLPGPVSVPPTERLALRMPWRQQVNLPDEGELVLGRSSEVFRRDTAARAATQVSREHARFYRDTRGELYVEDLQSANGTYVDGVPVQDRPSLVRSGQTLRLAQDVDCAVIRLNEHGEPE